jgi:hypothetical protein
MKANNRIVAAILTSGLMQQPFGRNSYLSGISASETDLLS